MKLSREIIIAIIGLILLSILDFIWFRLIAKNLYEKYLKALLRDDSIHYAAVFVVYILLIIGLVSLVLLPAVEKQRASHAVVLGALFGLCVYGVYNFTNFAVIKSYPLALGFIDTGWGIFSCALVSLLLFLFYRAIWL